MDDTRCVETSKQTPFLQILTRGIYQAKRNDNSTKMKAASILHTQFFAFVQLPHDQFQQNNMSQQNLLQIFAVSIDSFDLYIIQYHAYMYYSSSILSSNMAKPTQLWNCSKDRLLVPSVSLTVCPIRNIFDKGYMVNSNKMDDQSAVMYRNAQWIDIDVYQRKTLGHSLFRPPCPVSSNWINKMKSFAGVPSGLSFQLLLDVILP